MSVHDHADRGTGNLPPWLRRRLPADGCGEEVRALLAELGLATVCGSARCPNLPECFSRGTATFLILGQRCTRQCGFCAVAAGVPDAPRDGEPDAVAEAAERLALRHVVITSVTRDDLADGGAGHFARTIRAVRRRRPHATVEVLTPDFQGRAADVERVLAAGPDVFNHNVETVRRLYPLVRPGADYRRSLDVLSAAKRLGCWLLTKSGLMLGLGESDDEVRQVLADLRGAGCDMLTIGQYLAPSPRHLPVARFIDPPAFDAWARQAGEMGFRAVAAGPFVRSSYHARDLFNESKDPSGPGRGN